MNLIKLSHLRKFTINKYTTNEKLNPSPTETSKVNAFAEHLNPLCIVVNEMAV